MPFKCQVVIVVRQGQSNQLVIFVQRFQGLDVGFNFGLEGLPQSFCDNCQVVVALPDYVFDEGQDLCVGICAEGIVGGKTGEISIDLLNHCSIGFLKILLILFAIPFFILFKCGQGTLILL